MEEEITIFIFQDILIVYHVDTILQTVRKAQSIYYIVT